MATFYQSYTAIIQFAGISIPAHRRMVKAMVDLLDFPPHSSATVVKNAFLADGATRYELSDLERLLLEGDSRGEALFYLCKAQYGFAAKALADHHGDEVVLRSLLEAGFTFSPDQVELVLDLATRQAPYQVIAVESLVDTLLILRENNTPLSSGLASVFRRRDLDSTHRLRLAHWVYTLLPHRLTEAQEEVYLTLVIDGSDTDEALRLATALA